MATNYRGTNSFRELRLKEGRIAPNLNRVNQNTDRESKLMCSDQFALVSSTYIEHISSIDRQRKNYYDTPENKHTRWLILLQHTHSLDGLQPFFDLSSFMQAALGQYEKNPN